MFTSLKKIMTLPDDTEIYCGHEYTLVSPISYVFDVWINAHIYNDFA